MADGRFVSYLRVSTARQGQSGLGVEAQRKAVEEFLNGGSWTLIAEVIEIESGKRNNRPKLDEALRLCRLHNAKLVIAKLDRLSRDAHFLLGLEKAGVDFVAADMPNANRLTVGIMAMVADEERQMISKRTKDALAAAKARGKKLGGDRGSFSKIAHMGREASAKVRAEMARRHAEDLMPVIEDIQSAGTTSMSGIAKALNERGFATVRGGKWQAVQVQRVLEQAKAT
ncbi:Site-specific DNA recombinase [Fulvimarina manganoxydans]|uniref:Site-specific DNA recombinase n=1 Tax=Fulvimarina manganoxydans TaxID=937218 RepID=A0A1W2EZ00_9HYPH|nr:recombinase family protein [Fulvimarina manganoxydans]SMD14919.1 Site-specific DNA recombinase [Fulvimarina manganoxydans]